MTTPRLKVPSTIGTPDAAVYWKATPHVFVPARWGREFCDLCLQRESGQEVEHLDREKLPMSDPRATSGLTSPTPRLHDPVPPGAGMSTPRHIEQVQSVLGCQPYRSAGDGDICVVVGHDEPWNDRGCPVAARAADAAFTAGRASAVEDLRFLADARAEYLPGTEPTTEADDYLQTQVDTARRLVKYLDQDPIEASGWLPTWRFPDWTARYTERRRSEP